MRTGRVGRAILGLALVLVASACDDNPLAEDRDQAAYFRINPTNVAVNAGGEVFVNANVVNKYGSATNDAVSGDPCDGKISAATDTTRKAYELPERFRITGVTLGVSCLVVSGGGIKDTITVRVVPAAIDIVGVDTVASGASVQATVRFLNAQGQPVTGFSQGDVNWTNITAVNGVVSTTGMLSAQAPGTGRLVATLKPTYGVTRVDTAVYVVRAGNFTGTYTPANPYEGSIMTINASAGLSFDSDTQLLVGGVVWPWVLSRTATALTVIAPPTTAAVISNIGATQVSLNATLPVRSHEPLDDDVTTNRVLAETDSMWFSIGPEDDLDLAKLVVPAGGGSYRFTLDWNPTGTGWDMDVIFFSAAGAFLGYGGQYGGCATAARPEACTLTLAAGTYFAGVNWYDGDATTAKLVIKKQ